MAKLVWDQTGERYYETGVSRGVLYLQNSDGTYGAGVAWNGLTSVNESPDGADPNDLWADNIKYASLYSNETFGFTIEAYTYPDEWTQCDGQFLLGAQGAALSDCGIRIGQQKRTGFGFCYRTEKGNDTVSDSDDGYLLHIIYNAMAQPSDRDYETVNDSPDAIQFSWECTTTPVNVTPPTGYTSMVLKPTAVLTIDSTKVNGIYLGTLEEYLYGGGDVDAPTLPTPTQVLNILATGEID